MTSAKPAFKRQESWRYKRIAENWRRPRGVTSKMRKEESGWPHKVKVGYGSDSATRGLHPRGLVDQLVWRAEDLEKLDPKVHIVRIAGNVGGKKRVTILDRATQLNFHVANPGRREAATTPAPIEEEAKTGTATASTEDTETSEIASKAAVGATENVDVEEESMVEESEEEKPVKGRASKDVGEEEEE